ncbi:MAG: transcription elongation factor GreA [Chloroflexota bacterium]|nr:transcription elongation factor GreA [Chloroflexota bacterium]
MAERVEVTAEGKITLEAELKRLLDYDEPECTKRLSEAAAEGDLRENFAYHDARRELGMIRGRIAELRATLAHVVVATKSPIADGRVRVGTTVTVSEDGVDEDEEYWVVSEAEAINQRSDGKQIISVGSPMGKALLGKKVGDSAEVQTPRGMPIKFRIKKVN